ncbi:MAG TPA: helix-turn-helix transcriptional regulator [Ferruginibacter sp.]|nr:helix-turn-helix transcriptional regulator [Ferruginibacter sp.]
MKKKDYDYKFKIGENVRKWRILQGVKQKELAARLNLSEAAVSNIENDISVPTLHHVEDIATALGISISILLMDPQQILAGNTRNTLLQVQ